MPAKKFKFKKEHEKLFGKISDRKLASISGASRTTIRRHRETKGIPEYDFVVITPDIVKQFGVKRDKDIAYEYGIQRGTVKQARMRRNFPPSPLWHNWTINEVLLLGTKYDWEIGAFLGKDKLTVAKMRIRLNIPPRGKNVGHKHNMKGFMDILIEQQANALLHDNFITLEKAKKLARYIIKMDERFKAYSTEDVSLKIFDLARRKRGNVRPQTQGD